MSDNTRGPDSQEPESGDSPLSDETQRWSRDEPTVAGPADGTPVQGAPGQDMPGGEPTTVLPPVPPAGQTVVPGGPEHTSVLPPAGVDPWTGRAEVRGGTPVRGAVPPAEEPESEPGGRWWLPVAIALVGLLLLLAIAVGIWLVIANSDNPAPSPSPSAPPTTAAETSSAPTPSVSIGASTAPIPKVVGLPVDQATLALDAAGLNYRLEYRSTSDAPSGTVIGVDPKIGTRVPLGFEVLLVIATAPPTTAAPSPSQEPLSPSPAASAS